MTAFKISPMMEQYLITKENYKDTVLFYRLGDFYEFFYEDAIEMSRVLDLTLTGKSCGLEEKAPMCGIPHHSADSYINKLISLGYKVAICEQVEAAEEKSSKVVKRDVVRVVTAGTIVDESLLDEKRNNYIACVYENVNIGVCYLDLTTGEFKTTSLSGEFRYKQLNDILVRVMPSEILYHGDCDIESKLPICKMQLAPKFFRPDSEMFSSVNVQTALQSQFGEDYLQKFELSKLEDAVIACGALTQYIKQTQKRSLVHLNNITKLNNSKFMMIDINSRRNLELLETLKDRKKRGSLINLLDKTKTSMGARLMRSWLEQPLYDSEEINLRLCSVSELFSNLILRDNLASNLSKINDIERISGRISYGNFNPKDCFSLASSLKFCFELKKQINDMDSKLLSSIHDDITDFTALANELENAIEENPPMLTNAGGIFRKGHCAELDKFRSAKEDGKKWMLEFEQRERDNTKIKNLKVGYNRVYGYYIEVNKQYLAEVPLMYIRKQTVANNERFITEELKQLEDNIVNAEDNAIKLEQQMFNEIKQKLQDYIPKLQKTAKAIASIDCLLSFAEIAAKNNYVKPKINNKLNCINIVDGRHPVVEDLISADTFIANSTNLDDDENRTMIITGPNMAGKSTYMRQVAIITLLAHIGCFVPAKQAEISLTDRIFTRVGASDDLAFGQSTFMVEMTEVANILENATNNSLIILDEIGRGTSTFDGLSIAWSVVEFLSKQMKAKTLFATHYHELTELETFLGGVKNYKISVKEINGSVVFLRKIVRGGANKSFGIEVAKLAGVNESVITRAKEISAMLEQTDNSRYMAVNKNNLDENTLKKEASYTQVVSILKDLDINTISPISAFTVLCDLVEKVKK